MANPEHVKLIYEGVDVWNKYRSENPDIIPDLSGADLTAIRDLKGVILSNANLQNCNFDDHNQTNLESANFEGADLSGAHLSCANLKNINFRGATLKGVSLGSGIASADLSNADFTNAEIENVHLREALLTKATFADATIKNVEFLDSTFLQTDFKRTKIFNSKLFGKFDESNFKEAELHRVNFYGSFKESNLSDIYGHDVTFDDCSFQDANLNRARFVNCTFKWCDVYGISAWDISYDKSTQFLDLYIKDSNLTIDSIEVAQFLNLILENERLRHFIDTVTTKVVLILGRFIESTKPTLEGIKKELRSKGFVPVLFDFEKPKSRSFIETVMTIAHMAYFVIGDFTEAKIILQEAPEIVKNISVPFVPIMLKDSGREPVTLSDLLGNHKSILDTYFYTNPVELIAQLKEKVINPAMMKAEELRQK